MSKEWLVNKLRKLAPICRGQAEIYVEKAADEIERLLAENAELRKDAERYRWLRDNSHNTPIGVYEWVIRDGREQRAWLVDTELDEAIDARSANDTSK
jgi:hypothetical protein